MDLDGWSHYIFRRLGIIPGLLMQKCSANFDMLETSSKSESEWIWNATSLIQFLPNLVSSLLYNRRL